MSGGRAPETAPAEAPPTRAGSAHHRHRLQGGTGRRSPAGTVGGLFQHRRSGQGRQMATREAGPDAGRRRRLAGSPRRRVLRARYQDYTQSINGPPIVPPRALQALPCNPAKPPPQRPPAGRRRSQRHNTADRQPYSTGTASSAASQQAHSHSKHKPPTAKRHSRPPKPQAKPTRRDGERPDDHHRPGPEGCRYSGRVLNLCGCGGAKYF